MSIAETYYIPSTNGKNKLRVMVWRPEGEVQAVLQISHGMIEHIGRYDNFARFLVKEHILVVGNDHLGHGESVKDEMELGYFDAEDGSQTVVNDLHEVTKSIKEEYPGVPYFILGHSMGSFMVRRYLMTYGKEINGAIVMGTGHQPDIVLAAGNMVYNILKIVKGDEYRSKLINALSLDGYNKQFAPNRTNCDWLSRNEEAVDAYINDPYCKFTFTINGFKTIFDTFSFINKQSNIAKIPSKLPILFIAGEDDPVGDKGKGVKKVYQNFKKAGLSNIQLKLYHGYRHEILNEVNKEKVFQDIYMWIKKNI